MFLPESIPLASVFAVEAAAGVFAAEAVVVVVVPVFAGSVFFGTTDIFADAGLVVMMVADFVGVDLVVAPPPPPVVVTSTLLDLPDGNNGFGVALED